MKKHEELGITPEEMADRLDLPSLPLEKFDGTSWVLSKIKDLREGDVFRIEYPKRDHWAETEKKAYRATSNPYVSKDYRWSVSITRDLFSEDETAEV